MKRLLIAAIFISPSVFAAYTDMVIEGVKQSNGVWTAAGVMDTQGFVRTTGAVTVYGTTRNLPVALAADIPASSAMLKFAARAAGPVALAAAAYDVYDWVNSDPDIEAQGNDWVQGNTEVETYGNYWTTLAPTNVRCSSSNPYSAAVCTQENYNRLEPRNPPWYHSATCSSPTTSSTDVWCVIKTRAPSGATIEFPARRTACSGQSITSCQQPTGADDAWFDTKLPTAPIPIIISGWNHIPSLIGQPTPIKSSSFTPFSEWMGDPYFKDGNWWRDRMDVSPAPLPGQPTRVRVDMGPVKLEGQTDPTVKPDDTPASESTAPKEQTKFCDDNPFSIACQEMGKPEEVEPIEPDEKQFQLDTNQSWGASNGACPASPSVTLFTGKVITFDYQPTCDFLALLRPIIIAFALMTAIFIALGRTD